jgi:hypothetical protein
MWYLAPGFSFNMGKEVEFWRYGKWAIVTFWRDHLEVGLLGFKA